MLVFDESINVYDIVSLTFLGTESELCPEWSFDLKGNGTLSDSE